MVEVLQKRTTKQALETFVMWDFPQKPGEHKLKSLPGPDGWIN
jgi:hypothetical protein